jgi:hypothetical protein
MTNEQAAAGQQVMYRVPIEIVREKLKVMGIRPETRIHIYPEYPTGWHATVGANDRIYIFTCCRGWITLEIEPCYGFRPNGTLIRRPSFLQG